MDELDAYASWLTRRNLSPHTITKYLATLRGFTGVLNGQGIAGASRDDVEAFLATRNIGPRGRYHYLSHISCFYQWAIDEDLASTDPTRKIPRPKLPDNLPRPITDDELTAALEAAGLRMRCWVALGAYAGLRCQEIARLRVEDLSWERRMLTVSAPKGKRQRAVPIHTQVEKALRDFGLPGRGFVFRRWDTDQAISPAMVSDAIAAHFSGLGINATAHQLRHWAGSTLYRMTHDIRVTQEFLGHADPKTTLVYARLDPGHLADAVARLPMLDSCSGSGT